MRGFQNFLVLGILFTSFMSFAPKIYAKVLDFKPLSIDVKPKDEYLIRGFNGKISLVGKPHAKVLKVTLRQIQPDKIPSEMKEVVDEWLFSVQRRENTVEVVVRAPHSKSSLEKTFRTKVMPEFEMQLEGPPRELNMGLRKGSVKIDGWKAPMKLYAQEAQVSVRRGEGPVEIAVQEGQIQLLNHKGPAAIETYSAKVIAKENDGSLSVINFSGITEVSEHSGPLTLNGYQGDFKISNVRGRLEFDVDRSAVKITQQAGELRGKSLQGTITASTVGEAEVRLNTEEGNVSLSLSNSGAQVNLGTTEGHIYAPNYLRVSRGAMRTAYGRLHGKNSGQVYVRSQSGSIRVR